MNNVRGLFPPLYGAPANGGGGGGGSIQVDTLPEASLEHKDKIVQYTGATTDTLTNGYFYKCVEHTETEGETITVTYSWDNVDVMYVAPPTSSIDIPLNGEVKIGSIGTTDIYACCISTPNNGYNDAPWILALNIKDIYGFLGGYWTTGSITAGRPLGTGSVNIADCYFVANSGLYTTYTGSGVTLHNLIVIYSKKS